METPGVSWGHFPLSYCHKPSEAWAHKKQGGKPLSQGKSFLPSAIQGKVFYQPVCYFRRPAVMVYHNGINGNHYLPLEFKFPNEKRSANIFFGYTER
jgi:hypothetical protein